jgi:sulfur relay (sulfurtransferase) complex TusBCD TusD component (DsrE family)
MIRIAIAALSAAAALTAVPAFAQDGVHISLAGKSPAQVHAEIVKAASQVCYAQSLHEPLFAHVYTACISQTVARAVTQIGDSKLAAYDRANRAAYAGR